MTKIVLYKNLRIISRPINNETSEPVLRNSGLYSYSPSNLEYDFILYFLDIERYKTYDKIFLKILYPKFTEKLYGFLAIFDLTEEDLFYLKLKDINYEIIH